MLVKSPRNSKVPSLGLVFLEGKDDDMIDERKKGISIPREFPKIVQLLIVLWHGLFKCVTVFREPIFSLKDGLQIQAVHHEWHSFTGLGRGIR